MQIFFLNNLKLFLYNYKNINKYEYQELNRHDLNYFGDFPNNFIIVTVFSNHHKIHFIFMTPEFHNVPIKFKFNSCISKAINKIFNISFQNLL